MMASTSCYRTLAWSVVWVLGTAIAAESASAAAFSGRVTLPDGRPAFGAMLTVASENGEQRQTVFTNVEGRYAINTPYAGKLALRARLANYDDARTTVTASVGGRSAVDLQLKAFASAEAASEALPASSHNARLAWERPSDKQVYVSQCNYCHQLGNATTRIPRSHEAWIDAIRKMEGYLAMLTRGEKNRIATAFSQGFDGKPVTGTIDYGASTELAEAKIEEWLLGDAMSFVHDMDIHSNGVMYGSDEGHDMLRSLDPKSGKIENIVFPDSGLPRGGKFSGMQLHIGIFSGSHGPHSMAETSDGRLWVTNSLSSTLLSYDPKTKAIKVYPVPNDALYPHTIRVDKNDILWFTIVASNQVARFDPKTEQMTVFRLPHNTFYAWISDMLLPTLLRVSSWFPDHSLMLNFSHHRFLGYTVLNFPYGIDVNPKDGSIWYAKLYRNKIGRIDPVTLAVKEYDTPLSGPRRPRFDKDGIFWIPAFDDGALMRFDPVSERFETFKIPGAARGHYETPYALNVNKKTGDVWLAANNSDRILRFRPSTKAFLSYPSPVRVTVLRDFVFDANGRVCSSQSNLPAWAIEDRRPSYLCIDPGGGERDRTLLAAKQTIR